jgi:tRNA uridine 5-carboxymethylaminomethyl modification enzyme
MKNRYDIVVIGGGHAGIEAAYVSALMGSDTALLSMSLRNMGRPSCNPSIGGTAKGHLVKEIDALGGAMGFLADKAGIQFKVLNKSKGPAVWSPRAQIDKDLYPIYVFEALNKTKNLSLIKATAIEILIQNKKIFGVKTSDDETIFSKAVIFCPGTFLNGLMFTGDDITKGGRFGEQPSEMISEKLKDHGFEIGRLKTGTPPRVYHNSINFDKIEPAFGDEKPKPFSYRTKQVKNKTLCYHTQTNIDVHDILRTGFDRSPMFTGRIKGVGPRYCPSIEDKIDRFSDRDSHKILLEPEGLNTESIYVNGFSTSLPVDVQQKGLEKIRGLENVRMIRPGYAIEYDFFYPYQLKFSLETKLISGLYFAGQLNGTSGYEEAAAQGIVAGINASLKIRNEEPFILKRSESYIGVLIDDLVNKNTIEPYRIFTSLAEYRLLLRQDNAKYRLSKYAHKYGLIDDRYYAKIINEDNDIKRSYQILSDMKLSPDQSNDYLIETNNTPIIDKTDILSLEKRPTTDLIDLINLSDDGKDVKRILKNENVLEQLRIFIKYEGYIKRQEKEVRRFLESEDKLIPESLNYSTVPSLSNEAREKLIKVKPRSLGQASRISGVSAADVSILSIYLR